MRVFTSVHLLLAPVHGSGEKKTVLKKTKYVCGSPTHNQSFIRKTALKNSDP